MSVFSVDSMALVLIFIKTVLSKKHEKWFMICIWVNYHVMAEHEMLLTAEEGWEL